MPILFLVAWDSRVIRAGKSLEWRRKGRVGGAAWRGVVLSAANPLDKPHDYENEAVRFCMWSAGLGGWQFMPGD